MLIFFMTFSWLEAPWRYSARLYGRGLSKIAHSEGAPADKAGGVTRRNARGHTHDARSARVVPNLKTAKLLGMTLPPSILLRANEGIE